MLMSKKLSINNFEWIKDISQFNKDFIKNYNKENDKGYFFEVDVRCTKKLHELMIYHFHLKKWRLKMPKNILLVYMVKLNML